MTTLPPSCAVVLKSGNHNFLEPSGPLQACNGTALPFFTYTLMPAFRFCVCILMCLIISDVCVLCPASVDGLDLVRFVGELRNIGSLQHVFPRNSCMNRMTNSKGVLVPMRRLTPCNRVLQKTMISHSIKKFAVLYGARHFIFVSTSSHFLYLSRAR
jgi:hypothetical protein